MQINICKWMGRTVSQTVSIRPISQALLLSSAFYKCFFPNESRQKYVFVTWNVIEKAEAIVPTLSLGQHQDLLLFSCHETRLKSLSTHVSAVCHN